MTDAQWYSAVTAGPKRERVFNITVALMVSIIAALAVALACAS
jgi:hypothetical protein